jgi:hypothetical protein
VVRTTTVLILACGTLAACGSSGGDDSASTGDATTDDSLTEQPTPKKSLGSQMLPFAKAITSQSCKQYKPLLVSLTRGTVAPGAPATAAECKQPDASLTALRGVRIQRAFAAGTGGLMEGPDAAGKNQYTLWAVDSDGRFRYAHVSGGSNQIGTAFTERKEAADVTDKFLASVRKRDCSAMEKLFNARATRLVATLGSRKAACKAVVDGKYLAPALEKTPNPGIKVMGGTRNFAFVGVATKDVFFTFLLGDLGASGMSFLDTLPSTPVRR